MTAAPYTFEAAGQMLDYGFGTAASLQVSVLVSKTHHRIRIAHVNEFRIWPRRIKRNTKRTCETGCKGFGSFGLSAAINSSEHENAARPTLCQKQIAIRCCANQSWIFQICGV